MTQVTRQPPRSLNDLAATILATAGGLGYAPIAPGTIGSLAGVGVFWWLGRSVLSGLIIGGLLILGGIWASRRVEERLGEDDPSLIVIDEVAGQFITLWLAWMLATVFAAGDTTGGLLFLVVGFGWFRLFDIVKPPPMRRLERLGHGVGVVTDDVMAGVYAGLALHLMNWWSMV